MFSAFRWDTRAPPPATQGRVIRQALITGGGSISTPDSYFSPKQLFKMDATPVIIQVLHGLLFAGVERVVIVLDNTGVEGSIKAEFEKHVASGKLAIEFVRCKAQLVRSWSLVSLVLKAADRFDKEQPLLLVLNHLYDPKLLHRLARAPLPPSADMLVVLDDTEEIVSWAAVDHCNEFCKHGHCNVLVKALRGAGGVVARVSKKMSVFDALDTGAYIIRPAFFDTLATQQQQSCLNTLPDAMQDLSVLGKLHYISTDGLAWFGELVISTLTDFGDRSATRAVVKPEWKARAEELLGRHAYSSPRADGKHVAASPTLGPAANVGSVPSLLELGGMLGEGAVGSVYEARGANQPPGNRRLCVKMVRKGRNRNLIHFNAPADGAPSVHIDCLESQLPPDSDDNVERLIMWEVHVLQACDHHHENNTRHQHHLLHHHRRHHHHNNNRKKKNNNRRSAATTTSCGCSTALTWSTRHTS